MLGLEQECKAIVITCQYMGRKYTENAAPKGAAFSVYLQFSLGALRGQRHQNSTRWRTITILYLHRQAHQVILALRYPPHIQSPNHDNTRAEQRNVRPEPCRRIIPLNRKIVN